MAELEESVAQGALGEELWDHHRKRVGLPNARLRVLGEVGIAVTAVLLILPLHGVRTPERNDAVHDAEVLEDLERAGLDAFALRAHQGLVRAVDQAERDSTACQVDRQCQS